MPMVILHIFFIEGPNIIDLKLLEIENRQFSMSCLPFHLSIISELSETAVL
jgi:hypothetical protein